MKEAKKASEAMQYTTRYNYVVFLTSWPCATCTSSSAETNASWINGAEEFLGRHIIISQPENRE